MAAGNGIKKVAKELMASVASVGGFVLLLQLIPDLRSQAAKRIQDRYDNTDIKEALAVHREAKRNAKH